MGNATIWWWPETGGAASVVDLGGPLSALWDYQVPDEVGTQTQDGREWTIRRATDHLVEVEAERLHDPAVVGPLRGLVTHLRAGGLCSVAADGDRAWARYLSVAARRGATEIQIRPSGPWDSYASAAPAEGDTVYLLGPQPDALQEEARVVSVEGTSGTRLVLDRPLSLDWADAEWVLVQPRIFWPILRLVRGERGSQLLETDRQVLFDLRLRMRVPPYAYGQFATAPGIAGPSFRGGQGVPTLDQAAEADDRRKPAFRAR